MISESDDPVVTATIALDAAQRAYDDAAISETGLSEDRRHDLAMRLVLARRKLREAVHGFEDAECASLTKMLPALEPVKGGGE